MLNVLFLVSHVNFLLHVKYTLSYRIVYEVGTLAVNGWAVLLYNGPLLCGFNVPIMG